jgi:hypothetical protein
LEVSIKAGEDCNTAAGECTLTFTFGSGNTADVEITNAASVVPSGAISAGGVRAALLPLFGGYAAKPYVGKDRGNTIHVYKHNSQTSVKLGGTIEAATRITYDIHVPIDMSGHDDNGGQTALTAAWKSALSNVNANAREFNLYNLGDRSHEIETALTSLPNQVIPSVTVSKIDVTDSDTNSASAYGNAYAQSYAITFNNDANSGDQNMLTCNAAPCDHDGCINRGPGVAEVRYMRHDPEIRGEGINFVNQGYFIMDIGSNTAHDALSAGTIRIMWDTGAGISSAEFAVVATAAEVQTALRTVTGWEGVTVELWGAVAQSTAAVSAKLLLNHQFKVTFAAGYDDLGKSPTFKTLTPSDGAYAAATNSPVAKLYDQRFSNSIWLGKITGYVMLKHTTAAAGTTHHVAIDGTAGDLVTLPVNGDKWVTSNTYFGIGGIATGGGTGTVAVAPGNSGSAAAGVVIHNDAAQDSIIAHATSIGVQDSITATSFAYLKESAISVETSDYFAVGATIEVLGTTWDDGAIGTDTTITGNNAYRKFKVTGHVTNPFNREFAKLDSFPADDGISLATANSDKPDYNLRITSNNATVRTYPSKAAQITVNEIQVVIFGTGADAGTGTFKLYYKGEETQDMDESSTSTQVAEEINGFSHLSGPVSVAAEGNNWLVTFDAKDGDVAEMTALSTAGDGVTIATRANGWSIEGPVGLGLDTMQAGGVINVTAAEVCTFTETGGTGTVGYYCYDGVCGPAAADGTGDEAQVALRLIKDTNGDAILGTATVAETTATDPKTVTMPMGKSCDGLELRGTTNEITKTVNKHNNGKSFKITRSFLQATMVSGGGTVIGATAVTCAAAAQSATSGCGQVLANVDSVLISDITGPCGALVAATDGAAYPMSRTITAVATSDGAHVLTVGTIGVASNVASTNCAARIARHVITLDSMPTASATSTAKTLLYTSPVGSCSVAETTKGTYESYECSNRGACDGKSGLCTCYEGYSGQSCQTQTVLV